MECESPPTVRFLRQQASNLVAAITIVVWTNRGGSLKPWVGKVGWSSLVEMVYAVWFNLVLKDSGLGWVGVLEYILLK